MHLTCYQLVTTLPETLLDYAMTLRQCPGIRTAHRSNVAALDGRNTAGSQSHNLSTEDVIWLKGKSYQYQVIQYKWQ
jgi:hypothetical protein